MRVRNGLFLLNGGWRAVLLAACLVAGAGGCTRYESAYEEGVEAYEPVYCYASLADPACYRRPSVRDERRLINYYGPSPRRYDRSKPPKPVRLQPPPPLAERPSDAPPPERPAERPATQPPPVDRFAIGTT